MTDYTKQLVEQRRELHQWPEEGWTEFWTTNYIVTKLRSWGYEVLLGTKIINPEQVFGRNEKLVQEGIKNALTRGVSQSTSSAAIFPSWLIPVKSLPLPTVYFAPPNTT